MKAIYHLAAAFLLSAHVNAIIGYDYWCDRAITRLKDGPALFDDIIASGRTYEDKTFNGRYTMYWPFMTGNTHSVLEWEWCLAFGTCQY